MNDPRIISPTTITAHKLCIGTFHFNCGKHFEYIGVVFGDNSTWPVSCASNWAVFFLETENLIIVVAYYNEIM